MTAYGFVAAAVVGGALLASAAVFAEDPAVPASAAPSTPPSLQRLGLASSRLQERGDFPSLSGATGWLNSAPLTLEGLRGKVVVIDFWTYTCINWRREHPYVRAWAEKYKDRGLVVIGVHSPEFEFEKNADNVRRAAKDIHVDYPVAIDSEHAVWRAFGNEYWPALYVIDAQGRVRYHHFGEGDYEPSERVIQQLLVEAGNAGVGHDLVSVDARGAEAPADWNDARSPENYLGYGRTENFASAGGAAADQPHDYAPPGRLRVDHWGLAGNWTLGEHAARLNTANGRIVYGFHSRDLHLVMGPAAPGTSIRFRVLVDGQPPGPSAGLDVDALGNGIVTQQRMYQLIRQTGPVVDRRFEIEFLDPGVEAFSISFG